MNQEIESDKKGDSKSLKKTKKMSIGRLAAMVIGTFVTLFILGVLVLLPAVRQKNRAEAREVARSHCRDLVSAVNRHHKMFRRLPSNRVDDNDNEIQSWRIELLYFLGERNVSDMIDPNGAWDGDSHFMREEDLIVTKSLVPVFQSPRGLDASPHLTHFVAVTDPDSPMSGERVKLEMVEQRDGKSNTALFLEYPSSDIYWAEPRDVTLSKATEIIQNSQAPFGTVVALADGNSIVVPNTASKEDIARLFLLDNGAPEGSWWKKN